MSVSASAYDLWDAPKPKTQVQKSMVHAPGTDAAWPINKRVLPRDDSAPRWRPGGVVSKPNKKAAVALPHDGQSYHPTDAAHQAALGTAVTQLSKKQQKDEKWVKKMALGKDRRNLGGVSATVRPYGGGLEADRLWEDEEVKDAAHQRRLLREKREEDTGIVVPGAAGIPRTREAQRQLLKKRQTAKRLGMTLAQYERSKVQARMAQALGNVDSDSSSGDDEAEEQPEAEEGAAASSSTGSSTAPRGAGKGRGAAEALVAEATPSKKPKAAQQKQQKKKKLTKMEMELQRRKSLRLQRHPSRGAVAREVEDVEKIVNEVNKKADHRERLAAFRKDIKSAGQITKAFGRHHHQPMALEVAPSSAIRGNLRTLGGAGASGSGTINPALDRIKSLEARNIIPAHMRHKYNLRKQLKPKGEVRIVREPAGTAME